MFRHPLAEGRVVLRPELFDIDENIVGALWLDVGKPRLFQTGQEELALGRIEGAELPVVVVAEAEGSDGSLLEREPPPPP